MVVVANLGEVFGKQVSGFVDLSKVTTPNTAIVGRAQVTNFAADLLPRMGVDRIHVQSIMEVQGEQGASGERVYKPVNDFHDQIRFVGHWFATNNTVGQRISTSVVGDYIEVTFYGTGLNLLTLAYSSSLDIRVSVDGGAEGGNIYPASLSNILNSRNYSTFQVITAASGLSLGMHTVKLRNNVASPLAEIHGFEVVNTSGTTPNFIQATAGTAYSASQKLTLALSAISYNSGFDSTLGTPGAKGGHVSVYVKSDGTIAKAIQYTDVSQGNIGSANHTNEEVIRTYHFREFSTGRTSPADDWATLVSGTSSKAYTMDDGVTTLVGSSVQWEVESIALLVNGSGNVIFTFVGTGLDIQTVADVAGSNTLGVTVDGASIGSIVNTNTDKSVNLKVVSGLPYGTHVVQITRTAVTAATPHISKFIVYGPKKPTPPSGATEVADYFLMADYGSLAVEGLLTISQGVLRKMPVREVVFTGTWTIDPLNAANTFTGYQIHADATGPYVECTFVGTGLDFRVNVEGGSTNTITIDGVSNLTGAGYTTTASSGITFNGANGQYSGNTGIGGRISITNIPYGKHTIRVALTTFSAGGLYPESFDILSLIHSPKLVGPTVIQNATSVGAQGINDARKFSALQLNPPKNWCQAIGVTSNAPSTSALFVPIPDMICSIKTTGNPIDISYSLNIDNSAAGSTTDVRVYVDGVAVGFERRVQQPAASANFSTGLSDRLTVPVAPGNHTVQVQWSVSGGTSSAEVTRRDLMVREQN